jgi:hypothetical protein
MQAAGYVRLSEFDDRSTSPAQAARAREVLSLLESKSAAADRAELLKIKAALRPPEPSQADLVREFVRQAMAAAFNGGPFDASTFEAHERERVEAQNAQLARARRRAEEQRAAQVAAAAEPRGPARR